jgi:hypothetical protein
MLATPLQSQIKLLVTIASLIGFVQDSFIALRKAGAYLSHALRYCLIITHTPSIKLTLKFHRL